MEFLLDPGSGPLHWRDVLVQLLGSWVLCQAIAVVYTWSSRGPGPSKTFPQSLAVGGIVAATLMLAIGNSLVRGIGIVGTLALIRFRTNVRDPLDMVFIFASFGAGIAAGTGNLTAGAAGTTLFLTVVSVIRITGFGAGAQPGTVRVRIPAGSDAQEQLRRSLESTCKNAQLLSLREVAQGREMELVYQVTLKSPTDDVVVVRAVSAVPGAQGVSLSMQEPSLEP